MWTIIELLAGFGSERGFMLPLPSSLNSAKPAKKLATGRRVLIVDDSKLQRKILTASVKRWGFDVHEAESGEQALEMCIKHQPDFVLSDWMMPGMDGLELCKAFRDLPNYGYGYFILLTSKSEKAEVTEGLRAGADDYLTKPVNSAELRARISAGERILDMQQELTKTNKVISETLNELQHVYDLLDKDLMEAKKLQESLVRERHKVFPTAELSLLLRSSGHVGGDLVGFYPAAENHLGLFAIDVSGHGISSALMTARLAGYLSASAPEQNVALSRLKDGSYQSLPPNEVIAALNDLVLDEMDTEHYFTLLLADVNLVTGKMVLSQAGHPHPAVQRADGRVEQKGTGGLPVGLIPGAQFESFQIDLNKGDRVLILSDGVTETADPKNNMLGEKGLESLMTELGHITGRAFFDALIWHLTTFAQKDEFEDDVSGILFEFNGSP
jgi:sigma-B regulation protein RsbU (phosphoserine phosphatase)